MRLSIKIFGPEARIVGQREVSVDIPALPITCSQLRALLCEAEPRLSPSLRTARFAINCDFATDQMIVRAEDEIAIIGSVCGG
jgi:molybdopterin converting factor small subunit